MCDGAVVVRSRRRRAAEPQNVVTFSKIIKSKTDFESLEVPNIRGGEGEEEEISISISFLEVRRRKIRKKQTRRRSAKKRNDNVFGYSSYRLRESVMRAFAGITLM